jgi:integrase
MAGRAGRRRFGTVRRLTSGRFQASFIGPDGQRRNAPETFATKGDAGRWLTMIESAMIGGTWIDLERGKLSFQEYGQRWIEQRPGLRPRTVDLYRWLFGRYLRPQLGRIRLIDLNPQQVRQWRHELLSGGVSESMAAKAYRLLRAVLNTAVDDGLIAKNPCQIKGGGTESPAERPTISASQALDLADRMPDQYRMLVLLAVFGSLRWGEVTALRRSDVDTERGTVTVRGALSERSTGEMVLGPPKSAAGLRTVMLPAPVAEQLRVHLDAHVAVGDQAWIFSGTAGQPLRRSNFNKLVGWSEVVQQMGLRGLHFHDLRHTGNHLAAQTPGATLRDLMVRMGHGSMRAALIYQHASRDADRHIAESLGDRLAPLWPVATGQQAPLAGADRPVRRLQERTQNARGPTEDGRGRGGMTRGGL